MSRHRRRSEALAYGRVRQHIQNGDVLMFIGRGPISRLIRWGSEGLYSHCGVASWEGGELMVFHAVMGGVRHVRASDCVDRYDGRVDWYTLRDPEADALDRDGVLVQARRHLGKPFAIQGMLELAGRMALGQYRGGPDARRAPPAMFCSWYVARCYRVGGGVDLVPDAADRCTSPSMLVDAGRLDMQGTLRRSA